RLQVLQPDYYTRLAEQNYIKNLPIPAPRGRILDHNGQVLVDNYPSFSIIAQWDYEKQLQEHLPVIARGFGMTTEELAARIESSRKKSPYGPIVLRENSSRQDIAFIESHRREFPELDLVTVPRRLYRPEGFAAHLLGYVGEISEAELERPEWAMVRPGGSLGKSGIERQYDDILRGQDAARRVVVDNLGREAEVLDEEVPSPGTDLRLTLDYDLQAIAEAGFQGDEGALVALDPRTGGVLAMVSRPVFDPNLFATGIQQDEWSQLIGDRSNPLLNRAIQAQLAPGSVYKVLLAAAGLEAGTADANSTYYCPGSATFYGRTFRCWQTRGHGRVNVHQALVHSCDVFFYNLGKDLGIESMADFSTQFGLGKKTGIDLPNEESGIMPSPQWKERRFHQRWYAGETISVAIGQGAMTTTPLQLAYSVGGIASGGRFVRPKLVLPAELASLHRETPQRDIVQVPLSDETVKLVTDALYGVVNEGGTGIRARVPGLDIGGKTGTAQVASIQAARTAEGGLRDNAWFVGLAPRRNPEIVVAVLYQSGQHGYLAAPLARDVIKAYFDKKQQTQPQLSEDAGPGQKVAEAPTASSPGG
ncbi:MAG TPA: penicillin-binding protein 2, partial [Terriglobia bacterium]